MPSRKKGRKPKGDEEYHPSEAVRKAVAAAGKNRSSVQRSEFPKETLLPGAQGYGPPQSPEAPRSPTATKAPAKPAPARARKSVPAGEAKSAEAEPETPVPKLLLRFPVSLGKSGHPRKTTATLKAGNHEPPEKTEGPRESDPDPQPASADPVEEPAAPAQVPHTLETLLEQASGPEAVRFHSLLIIVDGQKLIHYSTYRSSTT